MDLKRFVLVLFLWAPFAGCGAPSPAPSPAAVPSLAAGVRPGTLELRRWQAPAERVVVEPGGVALGPMGGRLAHYLFVSRDRSQDLQSFVRTYAPFLVATPRGEMAFGGRGTVKASPAEQRMIVEWARQVAAEVAAGQGGASYGMVFAWHRGGALGSCDDVSVFLTGEVRVSSCSWPGGEIRGRLAPEQLSRLYAWFDGLAPFQEGSEEGSGQIREPSRLVFAGQGKKEAAPDDIAAIRAFAPALHRELAARRPGAAAQAAAASSEGEADGVEPPAGRLLLPPEAVAAGKPAAAIPAGIEPPPVPGEPSRSVLTPRPPLPPRPRPLPGRGGEKAEQERKKKDEGDEEAGTEGTPPPAPSPDPSPVRPPLPSPNGRGEPPPDNKDPSTSSQQK
jgi:hypothetical protein